MAPGPAAHNVADVEQAPEPRLLSGTRTTACWGGLLSESMN